MIIRINTRSNGDQLADYVAALGDNERVEILEVAGRENASKDYLKQTILSMELNAQLTKCKNPFLNAQINPAYGEDKTMTREDWYRAADILAEELGYQDQRRVIVLHTKKGRTHAHVVWERYNHDTQKVVPTKNSRLNAKFARAKIEQELGHKRTAWRNDKKEIKEELTEIWNKTNNGADFIKQAKQAGYIVAAGTGNRPFMVVDQDGVSCDLVRQLNGIRTKEVRARLRHEELMTDKQAIEMIREAQFAGSGKREREQPQAKPSVKAAQQAFGENVGHLTAEDSPQENTKQRIERFKTFYEQGQEIAAETPKPNEPTRAEEVAITFADNKVEALGDDAAEQERLREKIQQAQEEIRKKRQQRGPRR